jgi:hypothetical protein
MAEKMILVCDTCGRPAIETVTIKLARGNFVKDQCAAHINDLIAGARRPRPGRPKTVAATRKATSAAPKKRGRPRKKP